MHMDMPFTRSLYLNARRSPSKPAIRFGDVTWTYGYLFDRTSKLASLLSAQGVGPGDRICVLSENHPDMLALFLAAQGLGAVPAPINYRLRLEEITAIIERTEPRLLALGRGYEGIADCVETRSPGTTILSIAGSTGPFEIDTALQRAQPFTFDWSNASNMSLLHTSGTSGIPKGALRSKWGMTNRAIEQGFGQNDRTLCVLPVCLSAGYSYTLLPLYLGATVFLERDFDADRVCDLLEREGINSTFLIPTLIGRIVDSEGFSSLKCPELRLIQNGAGSLNFTIKRLLHETFGPVLGLYAGATEAGPYASYRGTDVLTHETGNCIGRPFFGAEIRLLREDGSEAPPGEIGEICVRSAMQFDGYVDDPELTASTRRGDMVSVGDLGQFRDDGYLFLVGRNRDIIKSGGINVSAADVEEALGKHRNLLEVACIGLPDRVWGEAICAVVVCRAGTVVGERELLEVCEAGLSRFQRPKRFIFVNQLPRNLSGKVQKGRLKDDVISGVLS